MQYFLMFHCLYYSVTFNESKGKFKIAFCCISAIKTIVALSSSSNFTLKLICWGILAFACLDNSIPMSLQ